MQFKSMLPCAALYAAAASCAYSQSLDQQYRLYLGERCTAMGFERQQPLSIVAPGQASEAMSEFCSRLTPIGGGDITIGHSAGGAGSAVSAGGNADDSAAVRRRRDQAREGDTTEDETSLQLSNNLSVFFSADYQRQEQRGTEFSGGREGDVGAANLGLDYRFGGAGVIGLALRGEQIDGDFASGGDYEARNYYATLFGSWFSATGAFVDVALIGGGKQHESRRMVSFSRLRRNVFSGIEFVVVDIPEARADGEYDATEWGGDARAGYDFHLGRYTVGPRIAARYRRTDSDSYVEQGDTIMKLAFDEQSEDSLRSTAALQASAAFTLGGVVWAPQLSGEWVREYRTDPRYFGARFVDDYRPTPTRLIFQTETPDRDIYVGRFGLVAVFQGGMSVYLSAEKMFKHRYLEQFGGALGVRIEL